MTKFQSTTLVGKLTILLLALLLVLSLAACKAEEAAPTSPENLTVYTVTERGVSYTVNKEKGTITDGKYTYRYEFEGDASTYKLTIIYPNSKHCTYERKSGGARFGTGFFGGSHTGTDYADSDVLANAVTAGVPKPPEPPVDPDELNYKVLSCLLLIGFGILFIAFPKAMIRLKAYGWVRNPEPSTFGIWVYRIAGACFIIAGVTILISSL